MRRPVDSWEIQYRTHGRVFETPHPDLLAFARLLSENGAGRVLDLGCGSGRHVVYLAKHGYDVHGMDVSPTGLKLTEQWLASEGVTAELRQADMTATLPYADAFFDAIIAVQVIHHGRLRVVQAIIAELTRILRPRGLVFITVPKRKHRGEEYTVIEPNTYVPLDGIEKGLPHHLFSAESLAQAFYAYDILDLHLDATDHHCLIGRKR
jgi:SAM-dependent methyltransferase